MQTSLAKRIFAVGSSMAMIVASFAFSGVAAAAAHSAGTNVVSGGTVYFINQAGQKQPYTSAGAFLSYGFNSWDQVVPASAEDLALPTGSFVPAMDGSLINDHGTVYLMTNGQKAGFTSAANFTGLGYAWSNVLVGDVSFLPSAALLNSTAVTHPVGTLVNDHGTVYLMTVSGKMGIPSLSVFNSWGYSFSKVVPANSYDSAVSMSSGIMNARVAGQLNPTGSTSTPVSGGVNVSLDSTTPAAGAIAKGAKVSFTRLDFTAGSQGAQVNSLVVTRIGLSSDSDVSNVYLYDTASNTQLAIGSFNNGRVTFTGSPLFTVAANSTKVVGVRADMSSTGTTGDSIGYGVASANDVNANGAAVSANFPVNGNLMTIAAVSNLGAVTITSTQNVAANVNPGTTNTNVGYFQFAGSNQPLSVSSIKLTVIGSISTSDVQNLKLFNGTTQVGATMQLASDKTVTFDLSGSPLLIPSGNTVNLYVRGDVVSGSNRNFQFTIQRTSDVTVTDTTYNTGIVPGLGSATGTSPIPSGSTTNQVTINAGSATLAVASNSPTGNIAVGATGVTLGTFNFTAAGEDIRISSITVTTTPTNQTGGSASDYLKNGKLVDVTGGSSAQVGSTTNLNFDTSAGNAAKTTVFSLPGYWTVPAGTTRTLAVVADTLAGTATNAQLSNSGTGTITAGITSVTAQGVSSLSTITLGTATARTLTFSSSSLAAATNLALANTTSGNPSGVGGQTNVRLGSFTLTAGSAEAVNVSSATITTGSIGSPAKFQNMKLMVGGQQVGTTQSVLAASTAYTFNPTNSIVVPAGSAIVLDVYADIVSGAASGSVSNAFNLSGLTATGATSNSTVTATGTSTSNGQNDYIATSGTLTTANDSQTPTSAQMQQEVMGTSQQTLAVFNFAASSAENVNITSIKVTDTTSGGGDLSNLKLYVNGTNVGPTVSALTAASNGTATFSMQTNPLVVPAGQNISVYVKADINAYPNATSTDTHVLNIAANTDVTAIGAVSGASITPTGTATGNTATVFRSSLTVAKDATSPSGVSAASATQTIAVMNVTNAANPGGYQATFLPTCAATSTELILNLSSTAVPQAGVARVFKLFKASDLTTAVASVTLTPTAGTGTWTTTLTFTCTSTTPSIASSTTNLVASAGTWTAQPINSGSTVQYVAQFDTTDATSQKSFTLSIPSSQGTRVWNDGSAYAATLMGTPVTFGTLTY